MTIDLNAQGLSQDFDPSKRYDVFVSGAFHPSENGQNAWELYDEIGRLVEEFGKTPLLLHRAVNWRDDSRLDWELVKGTAGVSCETFVHYAGIFSTFGGQILHIGLQRGVSNYVLVEPENLQPVIADFSRHYRVEELADMIVIESPEDAIEKLREKFEKLWTPS